MQHLVFVTLANHPGDTSLSIRRRTHTVLSKVRSSFDDDHFFGKPFAIGGGWSGFLAPIERLLHTPRTVDKELGADDDAMLISIDIYRRFLREFNDLAAWCEDRCVFIDLDGDACNEGFVATKWLVIVEYRERGDSA